MGNCCGGDEKTKTNKDKPNDSQETEGLDEETTQPQNKVNKHNTKNDTQKSRNLNSNNNHNNNISNIDDLSPDEDEEEHEYDRTDNYDNRSEISNRVQLPAGPPKRKVVLQKGDDIDEKSGKPIRPSWNAYAKVGASPSKDRNMKSQGKAQGGETMLVYEARNNKKGQEEYYLVENDEDDHESNNTQKRRDSTTTSSPPSTISARNLNKASPPKNPAPGSAKKSNANNNIDDDSNSPNGRNNRGDNNAFDELNPEVNPDVVNHLSPKARREYEQTVDKDGKNRREGFALNQSNKELMISNSNNNSPASNQKRRTPSVDESTPESNTGFSPPKLNPGRTNNNNNGHLQISARRELPPNSPSQRGVALKRANNNNNDDDDNDEIVEDNQENINNHHQSNGNKTSPKRAVIAATAGSSPSPKRLALHPNTNNNSRATSSVRSNSSSRDERRSSSAAAMERLSRPKIYKNTGGGNDEKDLRRRGSVGSAATATTTTTSRGRGHSSASRLRNARPPPAEAYLKMPRHYRHTNPDDGSTSVSTEPIYPPPFTTPFATSSGAGEMSRLYDIPRRADPHADLSPKERVERGKAKEARMALLPPGEAKRRGLLAEVTYQTTGSVRAASTTSSNERTGRIRSSSRNTNETSNKNKSNNRNRQQQQQRTPSSSPARNKNAPPSSTSASAAIQIQLSSEGVNAIATRVADIMQQQNPKYSQTTPAPYEKEIIVAKPRVHQTTKHLGQPIRMPSPKRVVVRPGDPEYLRMSGGGVEEHDNDSSSLTPFRNNGTRPFPHSEVNQPPNLWMSKEKSQFSK